MDDGFFRRSDGRRERRGWVLSCGSLGSAWDIERCSVRLAYLLLSMALRNMMAFVVHLLLIDMNTPQMQL
ncbi:unnamed protein product [Hydatigera taeniaeformis]|uniref:Uncharacterized protein n=1 Tax=Hydatigena taeniaeformis TaxID=6205 RepID=A0A0R3X633_HYDTA|nr:unnamed protein product [Hydatigera taeniaeformis]